MIQHVNRVLGSTVGSASGKAVLVSFANHANERGHSWPSWALLAIEAEVSRATVARVIKSLRKSGVLEEIDGSGETVRYKLHLHLLPWNPFCTYKRGNLSVNKNGDGTSDQIDLEIARLESGSTNPTHASDRSHGETGGVSPRDGGGLTVRPETTLKQHGNHKRATLDARPSVVKGDWARSVAVDWINELDRRGLIGHHYHKRGQEALKTFRLDPAGIAETWGLPEELVFSEDVDRVARALSLVLYVEDFGRALHKLAEIHTEEEIRRVVRFLLRPVGSVEFDWLSDAVQSPMKLREKMKRRDLTYFEFLLTKTR